MYKALSPIAKTASMLRSRPILKDIATTTVFTIIGRSVGFLIPFFIAAWYGAGGQTDAFFLAYGTIFFLTNIFSTVVEGVVVPFIAELRSNGEELGSFIGSLLVGSGSVILVVGLIFAVAGYPLFNLLTGFSEPQLKLVYLLSLETLPIALFVMWSSLLGGILNAHKAFAHPKLSLAIRSVITLLLIFSFRGLLGIHAIPLGYVLGEMLRVIYLYIRLAMNKEINIKLGIPDKQSLHFFKVAGVQVFGSTAISFNPLIDRTVASWLSTGSISLLTYAEKLFFLPVTLFGEGLCVVLLSYWSSQTYTGQLERLRSDVVKTVWRILSFSIPLGIAIFLMRDQIVYLCYGWGTFPKDRLPDLGRLLGIYAFGLPQFIINLILARALLVLKDTKSLTKVAILWCFLKIIFNLILFRLLGLEGIVISTIIVVILSTGSLWYFFKRTFYITMENANNGLS